jgi:hypothetical protein
MGAISARQQRFIEQGLHPEHDKFKKMEQAWFGGRPPRFFAGSGPLAEIVWVFTEPQYATSSMIEKSTGLSKERQIDVFTVLMEGSECGAFETHPNRGSHEMAWRLSTDPVMWTLLALELRAASAVPTARMATIESRAVASQELAASRRGYMAFELEANAIAQDAYASRGLTANAMRVQVDPGVRGAINIQEGNIVFRECSAWRPRSLAAVRPFNQTLSDAGGQPIRAVLAQERVFIMQGNHRVWGATLDDVNSVEGILYSPQQWESYTGLPFDPAIGTTTPPIR